jgi:glycosyltransferase involved in cell wall biosynthesis
VALSGPARGSGVAEPVADPKRILIVCERDGFANEQKPTEIERFLRERGHEVVLFDAYSLSRASTRRGSLGHKLPRPGIRRIALYAVEASVPLLRRRWGFGRSRLSYYTLVAGQKLRRSILRRVLPLDDFDLIICEHPFDSGITTVPTSARVLYDCMTPLADELYYEGRLTDRQHAKLRRSEAELLESADHLSFSWETYAGYAMKHYGISGRNLLQLNWGCTPSDERASFAENPRIAFISSLGSRFINLPLLSRLTRLHPSIDVYGGPPPDPSLGLNYLGYASPTVLRKYQLGLITSSTDELRRDGFSAKHLEYIACGLPVLVPSWRRHLHLIRGSVPYDEETFLSVIERLSDEAEWRRLSDEAYAQAQELTWDKTLQPLEALLRELPRR